MQSKCITGLLWSLLLISSINALYEDQIKKFDWRSQHIGGLSQSHLELNSFSPRLLVSTRENVIASLCPKTGQIVWRQVLETGGRGDLKLFQVTSSSNGETSNSPARQNSNHGFDMLTVQGNAPALVRGWNANIGTLEWEWSLMPLQTDKAEESFWLYTDAMLYHVMPSWKSHLEVTQYFATTGQTTGTTAKIVAPWIDKEKCERSGVYFTCVEGNQLVSLDLTASTPQVITKHLPTEPKTKLKPLTGANGIFILDQSLVSVKDDIPTCSNLNGFSFLKGEYNDATVIAQADVINNQLQIRVFDERSCSEITELSHNLQYPTHYGRPSLSSFNCKAKKSNDGKGCLFVLDTADDAVLAVQQSKLRWVREEALANVVATEFVELPLADSEGALENEMKGKSGDIVTAFLRRFTAQIHQIQSIFLHVLGLGPPPSDTQRAGLVRDSFGLHKMLVVLTRSGKLFGIDNISGKHHWQLYIPNAGNFANGETMRLIAQRTTKHFPLQPVCTVVAKNTLTGNGLLYSFDPITGRAAEGGLSELNYQIRQLSLLGELENTFIKGILLMDTANRPHVYPENTKELADGMYMYLADKSSATLDGFQIKLQNGQLTSWPIWNVHFGGLMGEHEIIAIAAKSPIERVHSQGRVLGDRSVLYKYLNPNLIAVITQANDNIHKYLLNINLLDVVTGSVVFSMSNRRVRGPVKVVHSENWLAYAYYNDKLRRTEISTIELYEGKTQANSSVWSSFNAPPMPMVERQSYIIPMGIEAMRETITERGITNKHILLGTTSGSVIEMPWALLDPRRPISSTTQGREEGAIPYMPELPLSSENTINYNQTVARISNIYTSPSGLESTCLVLVTGLDMFVSRASPSKTFDLLKEDFDYILITIVLIALTTGSMVAKHLASRKLLKQAWK